MLKNHPEDKGKAFCTCCGSEQWSDAVIFACVV